MRNITGVLSDFNSLTKAVPPDILSKASSALGEPQPKVTKALGAAESAVLSTLADKSNDPTLINHVYNMVKDPAIDEGVFSKIGTLLSSGASSSPILALGNRFLSTLFGDNTTRVTNAVSNTAGVKSSTATSILTMAAPLVLAFLGKLVRREGLSANGLASVLGSLKDRIPSPLSGPAWDTPTLANTAVPSETAPVVEPVRRKSSAWVWLLPLILGLFLLWGLWSLFIKGRDARVSVPGTNAEYVSTALPDGVNLRFPRDGMEARLLEHVQGADDTADNNVWFDFDRLIFETNSAALKPESGEQLANIAAILKAYPDVNAKVGGYTDNTGDSSINLKLSQDRADSVVRELTGLGVASTRLSAEGYGQEHPVADNSTEEGRAKNRGVALQVTRK